jgi:hypothetical protein
MRAGGGVGKLGAIKGAFYRGWRGGGYATGVGSSLSMIDFSIWR